MTVKTETGALQTPQSKGRSLGPHRSSPGAGLWGPTTSSSVTMGIAMTKDNLRLKNVRLRDTINDVLESHPELRDVVDEVALQQRTHVPAGALLERIQAKLQEQARGIIEHRPDLEHLFDE